MPYPIILFVYNRPEHTRKTISFLKKNFIAKNSVLHIFSDGPKGFLDFENVENVRKIIRRTTGFKEIITHLNETNIGLAKSIINGVTPVIKKSDAVIILEDDVETHPYFLTYMNRALEHYKNNKKIWSVTGFNYPKRVLPIPPKYKFDFYFLPRTNSWGWGTWLDRWSAIDWNIKSYNEYIQNKEVENEFSNGGKDLVKMLKNQISKKIDSWGIIFTYYAFVNKSLCLYPVKSLVNNIGIDGSGTHKSQELNSEFQNSLNFDIESLVFPPSVFVDEKILKNFLRLTKPNMLRSFFKYFKKKYKKT